MVEANVKRFIKESKNDIPAEYKTIERKIKMLEKKVDDKRKRWQSQDRDNFKSPLYLDYEDSDWELKRLEKVKEEYLIEKYFLDETKLPAREENDIMKDDVILEYSDKYEAQITKILEKWFKRALRSQGAGFRYACPYAGEWLPLKGRNSQSISVSEFIRKKVYRLIREISEPDLYFYRNSGNEYDGVLFSNLYQWRQENKMCKQN